MENVLAEVMKRHRFIKMENWKNCCDRLEQLFNPEMYALKKLFI